MVDQPGFQNVREQLPNKMFWDKIDKHELGSHESVPSCHFYEGDDVIPNGLHDLGDEIYKSAYGEFFCMQQRLLSTSK